MKKYIVTISLTVLVTVFATTALNFYFFDTSGLPEGFIRIVIASETLNEEREIIVSLPDSYERNHDQRYPVMYVLGGSTLTFHTTASADLMARIGIMPEVICGPLGPFNMGATVVRR